jgi:hypothetical protein
MYVVFPKTFVRELRSGHGSTAHVVFRRHREEKKELWRWKLEPRLFKRLEKTLCESATKLSIDPQLLCSIAASQTLKKTFSDKQQTQESLRSP